MSVSVKYGYEDDLGFTEETFSWNIVKCPAYEGEMDRSWKIDDSLKFTKFWNQADFGYIKTKLDSLKTICSPGRDGTSSLECSDHLQFCRAKKIVVDFSNLRAFNNYNRYREDVIQKGQIYGNCVLNEDMLKYMSDHKSPLQSWAAEISQFSRSNVAMLDNELCDKIIDIPTIIMKLDAGVNMYHHFCDFLNLYATLHLNGSFSRNVQIIAWDTSGANYHDLFAETWQAFTSKPVIFIKDFDGRKICFRDVVFSLLARMRYGLYYNTPLVPDCYGSGLFHKFSSHILEKLKISQNGPLLKKIRITLLSRSTKHRRILNENEIFSALRIVGEYDVQRVDFDHRTMKFSDQLNVTHNTDILIGMHGSGLTHLLFLPYWGAVFEVYNCDDKYCYSDLARLKGVKYFTWQTIHKMKQQNQGNHPTIGVHAKFTNYTFDVVEFSHIVSKAADYVRNNQEFQKSIQSKYATDLRLEL